MNVETVANPKTSTSAASGMVSGRLPCLDGLRALAIGMVLFSHAVPSMQRAGLLHLTGACKAIFCSYLGSLGVNLFFGLSGYLITHLLVYEQRSRGGISLRAFYVRRLLRIFPAFYLYLAVMAGLTLLGVLAIDREIFTVSAAFLLNYFSFPIDATNQYSYVGHSWSLAVEEQFYLFWPAIIVLAGLCRARKVALSLIILMPLVRVVLYCLFPESRPNLGNQIHECSDRLMYGSLLALLDGEPWFERLMDRLKSAYLPLVAFGFVLFADPLLRDHFHGLYYLTVGLPIQGLTFAFTIAWLLRNTYSLAARFLELRPMVFIGTLSYSLYLWQQPFTTDLNSTVTGTFPLNIICAFLVACGSYYWVEKRFIALRARFRSA